MKRILYALMALLAFGILSCKKNTDNFTIYQFDDNQIQSYIQENGLSGFKRDTSGGDTTGIYYKILSKGDTTSVVNYPDEITYLYTVHTFDNSYSATDTIANHFYNYLGHVSPNALQLSIKNLLKYKGAIARLLVPSRLAYGRNGYFAGSVSINGNQCLDYTISLINNSPVLVPGTKVQKINTATNNPVTKLDAYDDVSIQNYMAANGLSGFTKTSAGLYYKITLAGTGTDPISNNSTVSVQYTGYLFNGTLFDQYNTTDGTGTTFSMYDVIQGWQLGFPVVTAGAKFTLIIPSALAYGTTGSTNSSTGSTVPPFSCLRFDINLISVTN